MKTILCFGDSNTYGVNPRGGRHPFYVRWPGRLQMLLGSQYDVIEEGFCGRTTIWEDPTAPGRCGIQALLFVTLCRAVDIPARWQSGLYTTPVNVGCHDWAQFYVEPYGWLFADCSFGGSAWRAGSPAPSGRWPPARSGPRRRWRIFRTAAFC